MGLDAAVGVGAGAAAGYLNVTISYFVTPLTTSYLLGVVNSEPTPHRGRVFDVHGRGVGRGVGIIRYGENASDTLGRPSAPLLSTLALARRSCWGCAGEARVKTMIGRG